MYHRILGDDRSLHGTNSEHFLAHMKWVRENFDPIGPDELEERVRRQGRFSRPAALVTFDDGYRCYHDIAYPILRELGIPALVFLSTALIDEGVSPWTDQLQWAAQNSRASSIRLPWCSGPVQLDGAASRKELGARARAHLKQLSEGERRTVLAQVMSELGELPARERQMLSWDEVRLTMDLTTYGGHSHTHPILSRLAREACEIEIRTCRDRIVAETKHEPRYFAYPNGSPQDFTPETQELLRQYGFTMAFVTSEGIADASTDWMAVKRISAGNAGVAELAWSMLRQ